MGKDGISMNYLKLNGKRYNLTGEQMICDGQKLSLYISADEVTPQEIKAEFSNQDEFIIYDCVRNPITDKAGQPVVDENGIQQIVESDEFVATTFEGFTRIVAINYNLEYNYYEIIFVSPIDIDTRLADMESAMNFLLMGGNE